MKIEINNARDRMSGAASPRMILFMLDDINIYPADSVRSEFLSRNRFLTSDRRLRKTNLSSCRQEEKSPDGPGQSSIIDRSVNMYCTLKHLGKNKFRPDVQQIVLFTCEKSKRLNKTLQNIFLPYGDASDCVAERTFTVRSQSTTKYISRTCPC